MALKFRAKQGMILTCDFEGMLQPEMIKIRKVVLVSPDNYHRTGLHSVIPLSTTPPEPIMSHHHKLSQTSLDSYESDSSDVWAKCDMVYTFRRSRFDRIKIHENGTRRYVTGAVTNEDLIAIQECMKTHFGFK